MNRSHFVLAMLALPLALVATAPMAAAHLDPCDPTAPTPVTTNPVVITIPVPASAGPVTIPGQTVGGQTVGGQTVGPVTLPIIASVGGVPVVGTITIGGEVVGPIVIPSTTIPQESTPPVSVGPFPTGLNPITVTLFGQSTTVPLSATCASATATEARNHTTSYVTCVRTNIVADLVDNGYTWTALDCASVFL